jgi:hypothetical protein
MKRILRFLGRLAFVFVLISSAILKFKQFNFFVMTYADLYETFHVTLRYLNSPINVSMKYLINNKEQWKATWLTLSY